MCKDITENGKPSKIQEWLLKSQKSGGFSKNKFTVTKASSGSSSSLQLLTRKSVVYALSKHLFSPSCLRKQSTCYVTGTKARARSIWKLQPFIAHRLGTLTAKMITLFHVAHPPCSFGSQPTLMTGRPGVSQSPDSPECATNPRQVISAFTLPVLIFLKGLTFPLHLFPAL